MDKRASLVIGTFLLFLHIFSQPLEAQVNFGFNGGNLFLFNDIEDESYSKALGEIDIGTLRFPGGANANFYHWNKDESYGYDFEDYNHLKDSPLKSRMIYYDNLEKGRRDKSINQLIEINRIFPFNVMFVANIVSADITENIEAIQFLIDNKVNLVGVELGNELYYPWYSNFIKNPEQYATISMEYAKEIRRQFPNLKLGVNLPFKSNNPSFYKNNNWYQRLSNEDYYDAIIIHDYLEVNRQCNFSLDKKACNWENIISYLDKSFHASYYEIKKLFDTKEIWITEWNTTNFYKQVLDGPSELTYITLFMNAVVNFNKKEQGITQALYHNLSARGMGDVLSVSSGVLNKTHKYYLFKGLNPIVNDKNIETSSTFHNDEKTVGSVSFSSAGGKFELLFNLSNKEKSFELSSDNYKSLIIVKEDGSITKVEAEEYIALPSISVAFYVL